MNSYMSNVKGNDIKVAIKCLVYNHEPYLRECLEGFVMQQTNFPFVAIVHDDASTDHSADIIREYAAKYPDIIHPIYETENQWRKADGSLRKIMNDAIETTGAPYIALCEGDDYWTDPHKLQKQVEFLETNHDFSVCFHPVMVRNQATEEIKPDTLKNVSSETTIYDLVTYSNYIHTPSVIYRYSPDVRKKLEQIGNVVVGDYLSHILYAERGKIKKLPDYMAVYRAGVGIWTGPNSNYNDNYLRWIIACSKLSSLLQDKKAQRLLEEQVDRFRKEVLSELEIYVKQYNQVRSSYAYRLGKFLLRPFSFIRHRILK